MSAFTPSNMPCNNTGASVSAMTAMTNAYNEVNNNLHSHITSNAETSDVHGIRSYVGDVSVMSVNRGGTVVSAINTLKSTADSLNNDITMNSQEISNNRDDIHNIDNKIGDISPYTSVADGIADVKSISESAVQTSNSAVRTVGELSYSYNRLNDDVNTLYTNIGNVDGLDTINKKVVPAINEVYDTLNTRVDGGISLSGDVIRYMKTEEVYAKFVGVGYCIGYIDNVWDNFDNSGNNGPSDITTKTATIYIKHINTKPFDAQVIATVTRTAENTYSASMLVIMSKGETDWEGLKFKIVKATDGDSNPYFYVVLEHPDLVNTVQNEPDPAATTYADISFRVNGINFIPFRRNQNLPVAYAQDILLTRTIGIGTQYVTLEGLRFNSVADLPAIGNGSNRIATMDDVQVATAGVPTGTIIRWGSWNGTIPNNPPLGYVACNGIVINNTMPEWNTYRQLMIAYGYDPDAITTYTLPDEENSLVKIS